MELASFHYLKTVTTAELFSSFRVMEFDYCGTKISPPLGGSGWIIGVSLVRIGNSSTATVSWGPAQKPGMGTYFYPIR